MSERDPIAGEILALLGDGRAITPQAVERAIGAARAKPGEENETVARYRQAVRQQLLHLGRQGDIIWLRKGKPVAPDEAKGVVKVRLATAPVT